MEAIGFNCRVTLVSHAKNLRLRRVHAIERLRYCYLSRKIARIEFNWAFGVTDNEWFFLSVIGVYQSFLWDIFVRFLQSLLCLICIRSQWYAVLCVLAELWISRLLRCWVLYALQCVIYFLEIVLVLFLRLTILLLIALRGPVLIWDSQRLHKLPRKQGSKYELV